MYGFIGALTFEEKDNTSLFTCKYNNVDVISNETSCNGFVIKRVSLNKYANDKVFYEDEDVVIVLEGVIYNFVELQNEFCINDRGNLLKKMYETMSVKALIEKLNGYFAGVVYDKSERELVLLMDHITYKPIWYMQNDKEIFFSTDINWLYKTIKMNNHDLILDLNGAYCLLNYGYMLGDCTPVKNIKKLLAGHILRFESEKCLIEKYYCLPDPNTDNKDLTPSEYRELLEKIDKALKHSVKRVYSKDDEYGYKHCATLSGGLDSRLVIMLAEKLGYKTLCLTMGESNCSDVSISSEICDKQKWEHVIYELNNGIHLLDYDRAIVGNGGTILSPGFLHSYRLKSLLNLDEYGAVHSGDVGDVVLGGSYLNYYNDKGINLLQAMYGTTFLDGFTQDYKMNEINRYTDQYQFYYYNRGLNSAGNGCIATQYFTECSSPFIDKELLDLMFSVPYKLLKDHKIYIDYLKDFLPEACEFVWDGIGCRPDASKMKKWIMHYVRAFESRILKKNLTMNPYEKWYKNNTEIEELFNGIFRDGEWINNYNEKLYEDLKKRFSSSSLMDKSLSCTLIRLINMYEIIVENK